MNHTLLTLAFLTAAGSAFLAGSNSVGIAAQDGADAPLEFPTASPAATIQQRVGITDIEVVYGRPSMRGRTIFGGLEPYGTIWRTGANAATRVTFSTDVTVGGAEVPAGTYGLFTIPDPEEWTIILSQAPDQFGTYAYDAKDDLARIQVKPETLAEPVETMEFGFSDLHKGTANMYFEWETTRVAIPVDTKIVENLQPRIEAAMAADGEKPLTAAAMFYYEYDLDMNKAAAWMGEAVQSQPNAFWMTYRHGLILEKAGDKAGAIRAAKGSMEMAMKASGSLKDEYVRLNKALIERCQ